MFLKLLILTTALLTVTAQQNLTPFGNATQEPSYKHLGLAGNAVNTPISNYFGLGLDTTFCTHTKPNGQAAWWMFHFNFGTAYITDIIIYYRMGYAHRMRGFKLYLSNTSTIQHDSYLCYEDPVDDTDPNITQTIPCNQLGKYVIYYDNITSHDTGGPVIELCYVAINGCEKTFWGNNCSQSCSENCIDQHCFPGNGSCVWGCNCTGICNVHCLGGCTENRTGLSCNKYNLATAGSVLQNSNINQPSSQVNDGNFSSCSSLEGSWIQIDIKEISIVTEIYFIIAGNNKQEGYHTIYVSNSSGFIGNETIIYRNESLPSEIKISAVFRYIMYAPPIQRNISEICEIGIAGCPPTQFGPLCAEPCPVNCSGPCHLETGSCTYGCLDRSFGDKCELGCPPTQYGPLCAKPCPVDCSEPCNIETGHCTYCLDGSIGNTCELDSNCYSRVEEKYVLRCNPEIYKND